MVVGVYRAAKRAGRGKFSIDCTDVHGLSARMEAGQASEDFEIRNVVQRLLMGREKGSAGNRSDEGIAYGRKLIADMYDDGSAVCLCLVMIWSP